jgi:two-component system, cell cycle sensor histidine kinase DivJ
MNVHVLAPSRRQIRRLVKGAFAHVGFRSAKAEAERYRLLACAMPDAILHHGANGAVLFASPAAESFFGVSAAQLLGQGLFERVNVADRPAYLSALADAAPSHQPKSIEFRVRRTLNGGNPDQFVWVEMRYCRLTVAGSEDKCQSGEVISVLRDISERKTQEGIVELARVDAERANVAKSRFLATMSHELRTPLNVIIGFSEMLIKETQLLIDAARRREYANLINESGHHLLAVVNGILDMSKIEAGDFPITPEPFAPAQVVQHCCELLAFKAQEAGIALETRISAGLPEIVVDKRALKQVLLNLLSNAIKFTDRGGRIVVSAMVDEPFITLLVEDNGVGISNHDLPRLGEPFFQSGASYDRRHDGTGLGLSIVKGLVALHGGDLEIQSRLGEGTRVRVRLPLDCDRAGMRDETIPTRSQPKFATDERQIAVMKSG